MSNRYDDSEYSYGNISDNGHETIERGKFSRKSLWRMVRKIIPERLKSSEERFNNKWDKLYQPLPSGKNPNSFQVDSRALKKFSQVNLDGAKRLGSRIADGVSKIADAIPKSTVSLISEDSSGRSSSVEATERESLLSIEHVSDTPSIDRPKSRMPRIFNRPPSGLGR